MLRLAASFPSHPKSQPKPQLQLQVPYHLQAAPTDGNGQPERLVPVFAFSGSPARILSQKAQAVASEQSSPTSPPPADQAVPDVTRESIESDPTLSVRQKAFLIRVLDEMRAIA